MSVSPIDFQLDRPRNVGEMTYRPFGVATIKLKISSETKDQSKLRLRVRRRLAAETAADTFRGFPDGSDALMVSWGGGHEPGPCVKPKDFLHFKEEPAELPQGERSYIYFNLTHIDADDLPETAVITIEAYDPGDNHRDEEIVSTLTITAKRPPTIPDGLRLMEAVPEMDTAWRIAAGSHLQQYDPRWWPEGVRYVAEPRPLPLTVRQAANRLTLHWKESADPIVVITDETEPSILVPGEHQRPFLNTALFDLFNFDDNHIVLRVWFYWLNKQIGGNFFFGRHEVPDAERFDFLIRKDDGAAVFVCTDLHWAEMWGEVPDPNEPLHVSLGLTREMVLKQVREKAEKAAKEKAEDTKKALKAAANWLGIIEKDNNKLPDVKMDHNPINFIRKRANARYEKEIINEVREKGSEAHVPQMHGVIEYARSRFDPTKRNQMVSNDVRLVFE